MSDEEVREIRANILKLVEGQASTVAHLQAVRTDVSALKTDVQEISQWRGAFKVLVWIATAASGVVAAFLTAWLHK